MLTSFAMNQNMRPVGGEFSTQNAYAMLFHQLAVTPIELTAGMLCTGEWKLCRKKSLEWRKDQVKENQGGNKQPTRKRVWKGKKPVENRCSPKISGVHQWSAVCVSLRNNVTATIRNQVSFWAIPFMFPANDAFAIKAKDVKPSNKSVCSNAHFNAFGNWFSL